MAEENIRAEPVVPIQVKTDELYVDDLEALSGEHGAKALVDVLDRCVVGGVRGRKIPLRELRKIAAEINAQLMANLKN
jgi:hypothetical protein